MKIAKPQFGLHKAHYFIYAISRGYCSKHLDKVSNKYSNITDTPITFYNSSIYPVSGY